jgi:hypothetical protein
MGKYDALRDYLIKQVHREFELTFRQIEDIIGGSLPRSAERPQWWANVQGPSTHVQREAWRKAGYDAFLIASSRKVKFRRSARHSVVITHVTARLTPRG